MAYSKTEIQELTANFNLLNYVRTITGSEGKRGSNGWVSFLSPLRVETEASFGVNPKTNRWRDFGSDEHGDALDFVMRFTNCTFLQAINFLSRGLAPFGCPPPRNSEPEPKAFKYPIVFKDDITDPRLLAYAQSRGIAPDVLKKFCCEVHEEHNGKMYSYIGFRNDKEGVELVNGAKDKDGKHYKSSRGTKWYSFYPSEKNEGEIAVFEGFWDYLSFFPQNRREMSVLVLNSTTNTDKAFSRLKEFTKIHLYLDNDRAGSDATERIKSECSGAVVVDHRENYSGYNDVNDFVLRINYNPKEYGTRQ